MTEEINPATATLIHRDKKFEVRANQSIRNAIKSCDILPSTVLPVRDGELITDSRTLREGDEITLVSVISGGNGERKGLS